MSIRQLIIGWLTQTDSRSHIGPRVIGWIWLSRQSRLPERWPYVVRCRQTLELALESDAEWCLLQLCQMPNHAEETTFHIDPQGLRLHSIAGSHTAHTWVRIQYPTRLFGSQESVPHNRSTPAQPNRSAPAQFNRSNPAQPSRSTPAQLNSRVERSQYTQRLNEALAKRIAYLTLRPCAAVPANIAEGWAPNIGVWGGTCTCPDGEVLHAGDHCARFGFVHTSPPACACLLLCVRTLSYAEASGLTLVAGMYWDAGCGGC